MIENLNPFNASETENHNSELMRTINAIRRASSYKPGICTCMYFEPIFDEEGRNVNFNRNTTTTEVTIGDKDYKYVKSVFTEIFYEKDGDDWKEIYRETQEMPEYAKRYWEKQRERNEK